LVFIIISPILHHVRNRAFEHIADHLSRVHEPGARSARYKRSISPFREWDRDTGVVLGELFSYRQAGSAARHLDRRVHLEIRKIVQEHMAAPAVAATSADPSKAGIDASIKTEEASSTTESPLPSPSNPAGTKPEPTPGS
jgi:hypothetical protein